MLLQLSCSTSHTSRGTYLSDSSARSSARSRSLSMITSLRATYRKRQMTIRDIMLVQHTLPVSRTYKAGSWASSHFLVNPWVLIMWHLHYSFESLLSDIFKTSLSFTEKHLKNIFLLKRPGNTLNHFHAEIWAQISCHLVPWGIRVPTFPSTAAKSGVCDLLNLKGKGEKPKNYRHSLKGFRNRWPALKNWPLHTCGQPPQQCA